MSLGINSISGLLAYRNVNVINSKLEQALLRLSSGLRINSPSDDIAGFAISTRMRSTVGSLDKAIINTQEGIDMAQTAEGALNEVQSILGRMRELTVQAENTTLSTADRDSIGEEILALKQEIDRIVGNTKYNGLTLLSGALTVTQDTAAASSLNVGTSVGGASGDATISAVDVTRAQAATTYTFSYDSGTDTLTVSDGTTNENVVLNWSTIGSGGSQTIVFGETGITVTVAGESATTNDDIGTSIATNQIVTSSGSGSAQYQVGSEAGDTIVVNYGDMGTDEIGSGAGNNVADLVTDNQSVSTAAKATTLKGVVDDAIDDVIRQRGALGGAVNRFEYTIATTTNTRDNLEDSYSRITDADLAIEMLNYTKATILLESATAMLGQSNLFASKIVGLLSK